MKTLRQVLSLGFLFVSFSVLAQDTLYFNDDGDKVLFKSKATYYQTLVKENIGSNKLIERQFYTNGQLKQEVYFLDMSKKKREGTQRNWFKSGQLKCSLDYVDNKLNGNVVTYWENGQLRRKDVFENDVFKSGVCYNSEGVQTEHTEYFHQAEFPGGINSLMEYIKSNVRYPAAAAEKGISGRVVVKFVVLKDGTVSKISIKSTVSPELNAQALSVVQGMPKWTPGILDGEPIDFWYTLPIVYKLDQQNLPGN
jgi:periplasmic protein TonB